MTDEPPGATHADPADAREFAAAFRSFLEWVHQPEASEHSGNEIVILVNDWLGDARQESVVSREFSPFEHVNLQTALNAWSLQDGRTVTVHGIALPPHYGGISLQQLISGEGLPPLSTCAPALVDLPNGPGTTLACLKLALLLVEDTSGTYVLMITSPSEHEQGLRLDLAGLAVAPAQAVLAELDELRARLNVYRGHLLEIAAGPMGGMALHFAEVATTERADVVLPEAVLDRIERHALGVAAHREQLINAGQHLKRGILLFGPPGTGKTHTMRYLVANMPGYTRLMLSGRSLHAIGAIGGLARELEPAVVVLEDVDLIAEDRSFGHGGNPVLFELLDVMDGAAADADLLFLLTTNRADLLEMALAARPGRVDVAVEIGLPDAEARLRLFELYSRGVPLELTDDEIAGMAERTEGVTASFLKELVRRAVLEALRDESPLRVVSGVHVSRALDGLLDGSQELTRTLLGVGVDPADLPPGGGGGLPGPAMVPGRWASHQRSMGIGRIMYRG